jgi:hypothetical protein
MFIPDPDFYPSRIPDLGSRIKNRQKKERGKKNSYLFHGHKFHKMENYFIFEMLKKKIWSNFQRIKELLPQKLSLSSQKYGFGIRDLISGIRKNPIPDPGVKKTSDPRSGSPTLIRT